MEIISKNTAPALTDEAILANIAQTRREEEDAACGTAGPRVALQLVAAGRRKRKKRAGRLGRFGRKHASTPCTPRRQATPRTPATRISQSQQSVPRAVADLIHAADHAEYASPGHIHSIHDTCRIHSQGAEIGRDERNRVISQRKQDVATAMDIIPLPLHRHSHRLLAEDAAMNIIPQPRRRHSRRLQALDDVPQPQLRRSRRLLAADTTAHCTDRQPQTQQQQNTQADREPVPLP